MGYFTDFYSMVMSGKSFSIYNNTPPTIPNSYPTERAPIAPAKVMIIKLEFE